RDLRAGTAYTYATSSLGGCRAIKKLAATFAWQIRAAPETTTGHLPVVELGPQAWHDLQPSADRGGLGAGLGGDGGGARPGALRRPSRRRREEEARPKGIDLRPRKGRRPHGRRPFWCAEY